METRAERLHPAEAEGLPKWKLKANWLYYKLIRIYRWKEGPKDIDFDAVFRDVFAQFFLDEGLLAKDAEGCIMFAYEEFRLRYGRPPVFSTQAKKWKWIVQNGLFKFLKPKFFSGGIVEEILDLAHYIQTR